MARIFVDTRNLEAAVPIREALASDGHDISMVESAGEIEGRLEEGSEVALVLTSALDGRMSRRMISLFTALIPRPPVVGFTAAEEPEERRRLAGELGLDDCLGLPPDPEEVRVVVAQQLERFRLQRETGIVGRTEAIREVLERLHLIAPVHTTVLLTGESGTGKELVARGIHRLSPRRGRPFIAVNCAALPESLLESELFGHEKGAFTGATSLRRGMFELADGGSLLLDEIAEMPPPTQTRLLRVLESRRFMRVGGDREIEVDVRVIAATNRELREAVQAGEFRRDLYYRLNVLHIHLPPLRERVEDIPILVRRFVREFSRVHDREFRGLSPEAMEILRRYSWPGNVRELRNLVESMVVLAPGSVIRAEDIPSEIRSNRGRAMLPVSAGGTALEPVGGGGEEAALPRMEFLFRTLVELKMDVEDLRREFERYKERHPGLLEGTAGTARRGWEIEIGGDVPTTEELEERLDIDADAPGYRIEALDGEARAARAAAGDGEAEGAVERTPGVVPPREGSPGEERAREAGEARPGEEAPDRSEVREDGSEIRFEPGMTMAELEREAIVATLKAVDGNRRRAAEKLEIGERTLYRKLKQYDIDL